MDLIGIPSHSLGTSSADCRAALAMTSAFQLIRASLNSIHTVKAVVSAVVVVPDVVFERHSPFLPHQLGNKLAEDVHDYVQQNNIGYYPALDFFHDQHILKPELLDALDQLTWLATGLAREEVRVRLRPVFAGVAFQSMQAIAYSMPPVRPNQPNAMIRLAEHYTPDRTKFDVMLTLFRKSAENANLASFIKQVTFRHLEESFDKVDINAVKVLE